VYLRLPSQGKFYANNSLNYPPNEELPVLPMTAVDEITARTPDALFNGSAVVDIVRSCVPNITDPWIMPSIDLNSALVAIRLASYGHMMEIGSTCPNCGHSHEFEIDLRMMLDGIRAGDYHVPLTINDLEIRMRPLTYQEINEASKFQFEDQKMIQNLGQAELTDDQRSEIINRTFRKIAEFTVRTVAQSVSSITVDGQAVTDPDHILDFLTNCDKAVFDQIKNYSLELKTSSDFRPLEARCTECGTEFKQEFSLDVSNFFEANS
jgi:hypothetical protein